MEYINYQLEVAVCISVFYILHKFLFHRETYLKLNRYLILSFLAISFLIPSLDIAIPLENNNLIIQEFIPNEITNDQLSNETKLAGKTPESPKYSIPYEYILYLLSIILLLRLVYKVKVVLKYTKSCKKINYKGQEIFISKDKISPFTFLNKIVIPEEAYKSENLDIIINHELIHVEEKHNFDILLFEIMKTVQWFNPFVYLFQKQSKETHEFLADRKTIQKSDLDTYINTLLSQTFSAQLTGLTNNLNSTKIKTRLNMLIKSKSSKEAFFKYLLIIPTAFFMFLVFSCKDSAEDEILSEEIIEMYDDEYKYPEPDKWPRIKSEFNPLSNLLLSKLEIPERWKNKTAKFMLKFKISKEGKIFEAKVSNAKIADNPKWSNGSVDKEFEDEIIKTLMALNVEYEPAIKDGKAVEHFNVLAFIIGDKNTWNEYNMGHTVLQSNGNEKAMAGLVIPYAKPKAEGKAGKSFLSKKQVRYILHNIEIPESVLEKKINGTVDLSFAVDESGNPKDIKVEKSLDPECDQKAIKVIEELEDFSSNKKFDGKERLNLKIWFKYDYSDKDFKN